MKVSPSKSLGKTSDFVAMGSHSEVVTIGLHIVDVLGRPVEAIPAGQGLALLEQITMTVAGTGAATAVDLARLGVKVASVGVVGNDSLGSWLRQRMVEEGVNIDGIAVEDGANTSATMLPIRRNGERPALHVIGANASLSQEHLDWAVIAKAKHLHFGGTLLLARLDGQPTVDILRAAQGLGLTTSLDLIGLSGLNYEVLFGNAYPHIDYLLVNEDDALLISGQKTLDEAFTWMFNRGLKNAAITIGAKGAIFFAENQRIEVPAFKVGVVDTTGCGDAFSAGFIAGLIKGLAMTECLDLGVAFGSSVAMGLGSDAGVRSWSELEDFIARTPRL
jgi:sugar/nucleoside kinase (ribokinase family)